MQGASRASLRAGIDVLSQQLATGVHGQELGDQLMAVLGAVDSSGMLRRALTDPSREGSVRAELARRLFSGKVSPQATQVVAGLAGQRWSSERDFGDAVETLAVRSVLSSAQYGGRIDQVEDDLFRFERIVAADPTLREAIAGRAGDPARRGELIDSLLKGRAGTETVQLARWAASQPRGRRFSEVVDSYLKVSSQLRDELSALVTVAIPLDDRQRDRLVAALTRLYGRPVHLNVVVDPQVVGGIRVQVGDEVIDGTIVRRLEDARRRLTGA